MKVNIGKYYKNSPDRRINIDIEQIGRAHV